MSVEKFGEMLVDGFHGEFEQLRRDFAPVISAFKRAENVIHQPQNSLNDESAMRYIQDVNPIGIIDEPQSVHSTDKAKDAIAKLNPLCVLRYSATHREKINLLDRIQSRGAVFVVDLDAEAAARDKVKNCFRILPPNIRKKSGSSMRNPCGTLPSSLARNCMKIIPYCTPMSLQMIWPESLMIMVTPFPHCPSTTKTVEDETDFGGADGPLSVMA